MISARFARGSWRRNPCSWWSATGRPSASTTGMAAIRRPRMRSSASTLDCPESTATKRSFATGASGSSRPRPARMARRRSPSVAMATRRPASSTTSTIPPAPRSTASSPSRIVASFRTMQRASSSVTRRIWGGPGRRARSRRPATSATTTAPIATVARDPMPMWSRTAAPSPIVVSSPIAVPPPTTTPGARWLNAPTRTSCSTITPELTIACDPTTAPAFTTEPASTTAPGSTRALGETQAAGWMTTAQRASGPIASTTRRLASGGAPNPTTSHGPSPGPAASSRARRAASSVWSTSSTTRHADGSAPAASATTRACSPTPRMTSGRAVTPARGSRACAGAGAVAMRR